MPCKRIAILIGSTRHPRLGPRIAHLVRSTLEENPLPTARAPSPPNPQEPSPSPPHQPPPYTLELLDLADHPLPLFDEPVIPAKITSKDGYARPHTRAWSDTVSSFDAFVFVTPQYNWGIPAGLKNGIDFLFNEWTAKPAMVVSYGGHGGGRAANALLEVCRGLRMKVVEGPVGLAFGKVEGAREGAFAGELFEGAEEVWGEELGQLRRCFAGLLGLL